MLRQHLGGLRAALTALGVARSDAGPRVGVLCRYVAGGVVLDAADPQLSERRRVLDEESSAPG